MRGLRSLCAVLLVGWLALLAGCSKPGEFRVNDGSDGGSAGNSTSEAWLLDRAWKSPPAEALALADQHAQLFPASSRAAAREEIAITALVKLGRRAEAEARAAKLIRWAPQKRPAMEALLGRSLL